MAGDQGKIISDLLKNRLHAVGAEIGVWTGTFAFELLRKLPNIKTYYCVDLWKHYDDFTAILKPEGKMAQCDFNEVYNQFERKSKKFKQIVIHRMTSVEAAKLVPNKSLDFIFLDANHAYEYIKEDIQIWAPKIKPGGLFSGHDYGNKRFGVTKAVDELLPKVKSHGSVWYMWT